jgi:uncharacterized YigZ family protein
MGSTTTMDYFKTISKEGFAEFKDRGSRFLAFAYPIVSVEDFKAKLALLKKEHGKAVHHCFAYRLGLDGNNFRTSDDGEPSGTAGKPILGQIDSRSLQNICIIVVRYFGGTLLGVPGLINAYKTSAALALQVVPEIEKAVETNHEIHCSYPLLNDVMTILKQYNCTILELDQSLFCAIKSGIPRNREAQVLQKLQNINGVEILAS